MSIARFVGHRQLVALAVAAAVSGASVTAYAHGAAPPGPPPSSSELPPGPLKRLILDVEKRVEEGHFGKELVKAPLGEAMHAVERGRGARSAGDCMHGALLDKLAEEWAKTAQALVKAATTERGAREASKRASELETKVQRAEALLAEQQARLGVLQTELSKAEADARAAGDRLLDREEKRVEDKKKKPKPEQGKAPKKEPDKAPKKEPDKAPAKQPPAGEGD